VSGAQTPARGPVEVPCTMEIEISPESLRVLGAPAGVDRGERLFCRRRATVAHAGWLERLWTRALACLELTSLYEVGFSSRRLP